MPPGLRSPRVLVPLFAIIIAISVWLNWPRAQIVDLPRLSSDEVGRLTDAPADRHRMAVHLSSLLLRRDRLAPWSELPPACRPLWATLAFESAMECGSAIYRQNRRSDDPTPTEVADAYASLGAAAMAELLRRSTGELDPIGSPAGRLAELDRHYRALLPQAQAARVAYQRQNATAIVGP